MKNITTMTTTRAKIPSPYFQGRRTIICHQSATALPTRASKMSCVPIQLNLLHRVQQRLAQRQALQRNSITGDIFYDFVRAEEVETVHKIELQGFPEEEADTIERLKFHQEVAPELFLGAYVPTLPLPSNAGSLHRRLVAYVFATLSPIPRYTLQSMTSHVPNTTTVCGHTLCVDKDFRGLSIGMKLFEDFTHMCRKRGIYDRMVFIAKERSLETYEKIGFRTLGPAEVKLGKDMWYEMCINFRE